MAIKNEKDVAMEGQDWTSDVARSQAALNKQGASCKSRIQAAIYGAEIVDVPDQELEQLLLLARADFLRLIAKIKNHHELLKNPPTNPALG